MLVFIFVVRSSALTSLAILAILPDRDFHSLYSKALAESGALTDTGELLGRIDLELFAKNLRKDRRFAPI